ncbi:MAG: hypothetical protein HQL48_11975 [Gammaproteobacteria bacterium]|nr:hypothetical protein [Gammaproteobacteria bacterium]
MNRVTATAEELTQRLGALSPTNGSGAVTKTLCEMMPGFDWEWVLTRGHWHRIGGVVDADHQRITTQIGQWAEEISGGDIDELVATYFDSNYIVTQHSGTTHFFTAPIGDKSDEFIQVELEELQEVVHRPLIETELLPDTLEEFIDPLDYTRLQPDAVDEPCYHFRRITIIPDLLHQAAQNGRAGISLHRFFNDWESSSAHEGDHFCRHWVLALREYMNSDKEVRWSARPIPTFVGEMPDLPSGTTLRGVDLANAIHGYDRKMGFHFAWFFMMLSSKSENFALAEAVLSDQMGSYDYLPARDLQVLRHWEKEQYAV